LCVTNLAIWLDLLHTYWLHQTNTIYLLTYLPTKETKT